MRLHIANLSPKITKQQLEQLFAPYGPVLNIEINEIQGTARTAGSAIVEMHPTEAMAAAKEVNGRAFRNRRLYITPIPDTTRTGVGGTKKVEAARVLKKGMGKP
jgi:RNA recognition motif-containing protein